MTERRQRFVDFLGLPSFVPVMKSDTTLRDLLVVVAGFGLLFAVAALSRCVH